MPRHILRLDATARRAGSVTRELTDRLIARFAGATVTTRDLANGMELIDETWVNANFTPAGDRDAAQRARLALSDSLVEELQAADTLVIGLPIYNFGVPASLKAWVDQVARAGVTFKYTAEGPQGLLTGKRAIVLIASGGTAMGSDADYATGYIRHVLGFIGITDVKMIAADALATDPEATLAKARHDVAELAA